MKKCLWICLFLMFFSSFTFAQEEVGLRIGELAPEFSAVTHANTEIQLSEYLEKGPVVLIFYRGGWCYYCNMQLQAIQGNLEEFTVRGAQVIAVSVDSVESAAKTVEEKQFDFTVVSDSEAELLEKYNVVFHVPEDLAQMYKEKYQIDLEAASGREDRLIAVPGTYVIDSDSKIVYAHVNVDYKVRPPLDEIYNVLDEIENKTTMLNDVE